MSDSLLVPARYCGPARSGNGGYVAGALAAELGETGAAAVTVSLRQPPPLDATMRVARTDDGVELLFGGALVARATVEERPVDPVEAVSWDEAVAASAAYPGHERHPFPQCFSCGTGRSDGLRIFPGPVPSAAEDLERMAAPWVPKPQEDTLPVTWSALDCISAWAGGIADRLMVLGQMTAVVDAMPVPGEPHVVTGEHRGTEGRKTRTAATLHDSDGRIVGRAEHVWIAVDASVFSG